MDTTYGLIFKSFVVIGPAAYWFPAPFGRFAGTSIFSLGGKIAWTIQEFTLIVSFLYHARADYTRWQASQYILASMVIGHYINRSVIYPVYTMPTMSNSHLGVVAFAILWNWINGYLQADAISSSNNFSLAGLFLFLLGMVGNIWHDNILAQLKRQGAGYAIPRGGLYTLISFPTYFCEWIEWIGYAICLRQEAGIISSSKRLIIGWWFVICEVMVMAPRALSGHEWYKKNFMREYPALKRKAVLPFIL